MPEALETCDRHQDAIYWPAEGVDNYGNILLGAAVALKVDSWSEVTKDGAGQALVDREIPVGSHWFFGTSYDETQPILQVSEYREVKDIKGRKTCRIVKLRWLKDELAKHIGVGVLRIGAVTMSGGSVVVHKGIGTLYTGAATLAGTGSQS